MTDILYITFTVIFILLFPIAEYFTRSKKWRRALLSLHIVCAIPLIVVTVSNVRSVNNLETNLTAIQEYTSVAHLDARGYSALFEAGEGITLNSPLIETLKDTYTINDDGTYTFNINEEVEGIYLSVVEERPKFPFTQFFYALCLYDRGSTDWRPYAEEAKRIFELTTLIDGHHYHHDEFLDKTNTLLSGVDPRYE